MLCKSICQNETRDIRSFQTFFHWNIGDGFIVKVDMYMYGWGDRQGRVSVAAAQVCKKDASLTAGKVMLCFRFAK